MAPIVLIHGFPFDSTMWAAQAAFLRERGHTVITPDLPGFGHVPAWPREKTSMEAYAAGIHQLIQEQAGAGERKAIVGGFSMGGYILLQLLREYPDSVEAAMFIDTRPDADSADARANRMKSIEEIQANGPAAVVETMLPKMLSKKPTEAMRQKVRGMMEQQTNRDGLVNALAAMAKRRDQSDLLAELKLPVLVVVGADDSITPPSVALAMQSHMPQAMVVQIVGAGHASPVEQAGPVNGAIETFLATVR